MQTLKNLWNTLLNLICKIYGYDRKADVAKTEAMAEEAKVEIAAMQAETAAVAEQAEERIAEIEAQSEHDQKCHEVYLAILELCQKHGYNHLEAQYAHDIKDLAALEHILDDMTNQRYGYEIGDDVQPGNKGPKVKRMRKNKQQ